MTSVTLTLPAKHAAPLLHKAVQDFCRTSLHLQIKRHPEGRNMPWQTAHYMRGQAGFTKWQLDEQDKLAKAIVTINAFGLKLPTVTLGDEIRMFNDDPTAKGANVKKVPVFSSFRAAEKCKAIADQVTAEWLSEKEEA